MSDKPFQLPQVQVYETARGHHRIRAGKITLSVTQALDLAFRLHTAATKAATMPRSITEAQNPLGCPCVATDAGHMKWSPDCPDHAGRVGSA